MGPLATLDALRGQALSVLGPIAPSMIRDRERRVTVYGLAAIGLALCLTFAAPMALLAFGPLLLGVPHLLGDVRYLVARPGLHRRPEVWLFIAGPACAAWIHPHAWVSMLAPVGAVLVARASFLRRAIAAVGAVALLIACSEMGRTADVLLAHAHNAIAVLLFCLWSGRKGRVHLLVVLAFIAGVVAIGLGAFDAASARLFQSNLLDSEMLAESLAPLSDAGLASRAILVFAFAQSVHYAVWVRLVPEVDRPRPGLRSFSSSLRALVADLGVPVLVVAGLVAVGIATWGCISLVAARDGYLRLAIFHGPLELGAATLLFLEHGAIGRSLSSGGSSLHREAW